MENNDNRITISFYYKDEDGSEYEAKTSTEPIYDFGIRPLDIIGDSLVAFLRQCGFYMQGNHLLMSGLTDEEEEYLDACLREYRESRSPDNDEEPNESAESDKSDIVAAEFNSVWDDNTILTSSCNVNLKTREVYNIFRPELDLPAAEREALGALSWEYIVLDGETYTVNIGDNNNISYWRKEDLEVK